MDETRVRELIIEAFKTLSETACEREKGYWYEGSYDGARTSLVEFVDTAIGRYHDQHIAPTTLHGVPADAQAAMRARYIEDVKNNPVALWQIAVATVAEDARERLARHLYLDTIPADWRGHHELLWDHRSDRIDYDAVYARADELLAVITGKDT